MSHLDSLLGSQMAEQHRRANRDHALAENAKTALVELEPDLLRIHKGILVLEDGSTDMVCECCREPGGARELFPCPTIRLVRNLTRAAMGVR